MVIFDGQLLLSSFTYLINRAEITSLDEINYWSGIMTGIFVMVVTSTVSKTLVRIFIYQLFFLVGLVDKYIGNINFNLSYWGVFTLAIILFELVNEMKKKSIKIKERHFTVEPQTVYEIFDQTPQGIIIFNLD